MSEFFDPYNADRPLMLKCSCGRDHSPADHHAEVAADAAAAQLRARSETAEFEAYSQEFIEATLVKALFPQDQERRMFLRAVGKKTAMAAIASVLPVASTGASLTAVTSYLSSSRTLCTALRTEGSSSAISTLIFPLITAS